MKKFFEKHDLFKASGIVLVIAILLSWLCSNAYYQNGELVTDEIVRVGLFDISTYGLLGMYYFTTTLMFVFVISGFYKFLGSTEAYQKLTDGVAKIFTGKEKIFVAISTLFFAAWAGVATDYYVLLALIPFAISILSKLKVDKVVGVSATFGGALVGILGATYSTKIVGTLVTALQVKYGFELITTIILFAIAYILLLFFTFLRMSKKKDAALLVDPFAKEVVETKKAKNKKEHKISVIPLAIVMFVAVVLLILAFIGWESAFTVTLFTDVHDWVVNAELFNTPIFSYILGSVYSNAASSMPYVFGNWDLFGAACVLFVTTFIIKIIYHIPFDKILDEYGEGFKIAGKSVVVLFVIFTTLEISLIFPTIPVVVSKIMSIGNNFFTLFISGALTSVFAVDFQYINQLIGSLFTTASNSSIGALIFQTSYGFASFIAPTSVMLMLGLSMMNVRYSEWIKHIWKFAISLLVVIMIILAILTYI